MSTVCVFHDGKGKLDPLTDLRPSFDIRTGALTTLERMDRSFGITAGIWVPDEYRGMRCDHHDRPVNEITSKSVLCLNGRWVDAHDAADLDMNQALVCGDEVLAAHITAEQAENFLRTGELDPTVETTMACAEKILHRPWDVIRFLSDMLQKDLHLLDRGGSRVGEGVVVIGSHDIDINPAAKVYPTVVLDSEKGPIYIAQNAVIRPRAIIMGPAYIGPDTIIQDGAVIRPGVAFGPVCKVGGEVGSCIIQGYSNKGHDGYLGDSYLGEWVNFGAGTITSNLKNTYGNVRARNQADEQPQDTGLMYLGSIVGDHVKTAIGTRLLTGTVLMTGAQITDNVPPPKFVDRFAWISPAGTSSYEIDKFITVAKRVLQRRNEQLPDPCVTRLRALHK